MSGATKSFLCRIKQRRRLRLSGAGSSQSRMFDAAPRRPVSSNAGLAGICPRTLDASGPAERSVLKRLARYFLANKPLTILYLTVLTSVVNYLVHATAISFPLSPGRLLLHTSAKSFTISTYGLFCNLQKTRAQKPRVCTLLRALCRNAFSNSCRIRFIRALAQNNGVGGIIQP